MSKGHVPPQIGRRVTVIGPGGEEIDTVEVHPVTEEEFEAARKSGEELRRRMTGSASARTSARYVENLRTKLEHEKDPERARVWEHALIRHLRRTGDIEQAARLARVDDEKFWAGYAAFHRPDDEWCDCPMPVNEDGVYVQPVSWRRVYYPQKPGDTYLFLCKTCSMMNVTDIWPEQARRYQRILEQMPRYAPGARRPDEKAFLRAR